MSLASDQEIRALGWRLVSFVLLAVIIGLVVFG
jgi:hypothetical protein